MKQFLSLEKTFFILTLIFIFAGCGYKPNAHFTKEVVGDKISTSVIISEEDPENTVVIKDAVDSAVIEVFKASLVEKELSDTHLILKIGKPKYTPIVFDEKGYVIGYRMKITLNITKESDKKIKNYQSIGYHDFSIERNAVISDQQRYEAINFASQRAIKAFIAQVSAEGARAKK